MKYTLSIAVGVLAALPSAFAQSAGNPGAPIGAPANPGAPVEADRPGESVATASTEQATPPDSTGPIKAKHTEVRKGYEGQTPSACEPVGTIYWNDTYLPCLEAVDIVRDSAVVGKNGTDQQAQWSSQRDYLCDKERAYFKIAGEGCLGCKQAYKIESPENAASYIKLHETIESDYCNAETLTGNYDSYFKKHYDQMQSTLKYPVPFQRVKPFTIPVESYFNHTSPQKDNKTAPATVQSEDGKVPIPSVPQHIFAVIYTTPSLPSAKFNTTSTPFYVDIVITPMCFVQIKGSEKTVSCEESKREFVKVSEDKLPQPSQTPANDSSKTPATDSSKTPANGSSKTPALDLTRCTCAKDALPKGQSPASQPTKSEKESSGESGSQSQGPSENGSGNELPLEQIIVVFSGVGQSPNGIGGESGSKRPTPAAIDPKAEQGKAEQGNSSGQEEDMQCEE